MRVNASRAELAGPRQRAPVLELDPQLFMPPLQVRAVDVYRSAQERNVQLVPSRHRIQGITRNSWMAVRWPVRPAAHNRVGEGGDRDREIPCGACSQRAQSAGYGRSQTAARAERTAAGTPLPAVP